MLGYPAATPTHVGTTPTPTPVNPRIYVIFNESAVLVAFRPAAGCLGSFSSNVEAFYSDEHALTLGVRQYNLKQRLCVGGVNSGQRCVSNAGCPGSTCGSATTTTTNQTVTAMTVNPDSATSPSVGFRDDVDGTGKTINNFNTLGSTDSNTCVDPAGCARPMRPVLYVTDISFGLSQVGDWQYGDTNENHPNDPDFVSGTWKAAVKTVDYSSSLTSPTITVTPDSDPAGNTTLGPGADPLPSPFNPAEHGYLSEVRWNVGNLHDQQGQLLQLNHTYRLQFLVHDGDQNKVGGDSGQACVNAQLTNGGPAFGPGLAILGRQAVAPPRVAEARVRPWSLGGLLRSFSSQLNHVFLSLAR